MKFNKLKLMVLGDQNVGKTVRRRRRETGVRESTQGKKRKRESGEGGDKTADSSLTPTEPHPVPERRHRHVGDADVSVYFRPSAPLHRRHPNLILGTRGGGRGGEGEAGCDILCVGLRGAGGVLLVRREKGGGRREEGGGRREGEERREEKVWVSGAGESASCSDFLIFGFHLPFLPPSSSLPLSLLSTHQFFLSGRAIYIIVWDLRLPFLKSHIPFWVDSIQARAGHPPTLLVGTYLDVLTPDRVEAAHKEVEEWMRERREREAKKRERGGRREGGGKSGSALMGFRCVSCKNRQGIDDVIQSLKKSAHFLF